MGTAARRKKNVIKSGKDPPVASVIQDLCYAVISAKSYHPYETRNFTNARGGGETGQGKPRSVCVL